MHRRPSAASTISLPSSHRSLQPLSILGSPSFVSLANGKLRSPPTPNRSASLHTVIDPPQENAAVNYEADELFITHSVSEIKNIQRRLRAEADAKQEELRLMVGERYRDLLQASTSIISIAQSSEQVLHAFDEMKDIILSQEIPQMSRGLSPHSKDDSNLQTFQSLGAHMKLLLDAPEHLWRLIERKEYFRAAWLFLLAGVVHRALIDDDAEESMNWRIQGISVPDQFPLVQRQWETIVQFRPQISHKATLSLRDPLATVEHVCATLLTLYLLDSRPLAETLSIFLTQRSRTLSSVLSKTTDSATHHGSVTRPNNQPFHKNSTKMTMDNSKEVRQSVEASLDVISRTLGTSRAIFEKQSDADHSLMTLALNHIQPDTDVSTKILPLELKLTTQSLLANLPSSTHFLLLPTSIKSYKPYVDLSSQSSSFPQAILTKRLEEWFHKAMQELNHTLIIWFSTLRSMTDVWRLRLCSQKWIVNAHALQDHERRDIASVVDDTCRQQLTSIWKASLMKAKADFKRELTLAVQAKGNSLNASSSGSLSLPFLLQAPSPPLSPSINLGTSQASASLYMYKSALRRRVAGRAPLLEQVLEPIETCAESLQKDLNSLKAEDDDTMILITQLLDEYKPEAEALCLSVADALKTVVDGIDDDPEGAGPTLIFISNLIEELTSSSKFVDHLGCEKDVIQVFQDRVRELHDRLVDRWRVHTLSRISQEYWRMCATSTAILKDGNARSLTHSPAAIKSLLALSTALQELGSVLEPSRRDVIAKEALYGFLQAMSDVDLGQKMHPGHRWTILFLQKLLDVWDSRWLESVPLLQVKLQKIIRTDVEEQEDTQLSSYLAGTQTLLASLFPTAKKETTSTSKVGKAAALLPHGIPTVPQDLQPTMDIVKPSPRFGLLLVGSTAVR